MEKPIEISPIVPTDPTLVGKNESIPLEDIKSWERKRPFRRLGVAKNATPEEVQEAFEKLAKKYHPDKVSYNEELRKNYEEVFKLISDARDTFIASYITDDKKEEMREAIMRKFGISSEYFDYIEYFFHGFEDENGKGIFNEKNEVKNFLARTKTAMDQFSFEYQTKYILADMERLVKNGVPKEKLLKSIEPIVMKYVNQILDKKHWSIEGFNRDIGYVLYGVESLGIDQKGLKPKVEAIAKNLYVHGIGRHFFEDRIEFACKHTERDKEELKRLNIDPEELLPKIEGYIIKKFVSVVSVSFDPTTMRPEGFLLTDERYKYIITKANENIGYITKYVGVSKEKLIDSINDFKDREGNKLVDFL